MSNRPRQCHPLLALAFRPRSGREPGFRSEPRPGVRASAISSEGETPSKCAFTIPRSRDSGFSAWVEYTRNGLPSHDAEYTMVLPPFANRPLSMMPRRKVTRWNEGEGARDVRRPTTNMPRQPAQTPAASAIIRPVSPRRGICGASSISSRQSPIACSRCFGSFCRHGCKQAPHLQSAPRPTPAPSSAPPPERR